jgi:gliding motility-associated-like protein
MRRAPNLYHIASFLLLVVPSINCTAQFSWLYEFQGLKSTMAFKLSIDNNNNLYTVGTFDNDLTINSTTYNGGGSFLAKFDNNGNVIWQKIITSLPGKFAGFAFVKTDAAGNVYVTGNYDHQVNFETKVLQSDGLGCFLAKFDTDGTLLWTKNYPGLQEIWDMNSNDQGDVIIYSTHWTTIDIDALTLEPFGNSFAVVYSTNGNVLWTRVIGDNASSNTNAPVAAAIDNNRNIYLNGRFREDLKLDGYEAPSNNYYDMFITKFNSAGICEWIDVASRKIDPIYDSWNAIVERGDMSVDLNGDLYLVGAYYTELEIGDFNLKGNSSFSYNDNIFAASLTNAGKVRWASGQAYAENSYAENVTVVNGKTYTSGTIGYVHYFSVLNNTDGSLEKLVKMPIEYADIFNGLVVDQANNVYMSGRRRPLNNIYVGYLFKYNVQVPIVIGNGSISDPSSICATEQTVLIKTVPIENASIYEWKITFDNNTIAFETTDPELKLILADYGITGNFSVRVRGKKENLTGSYSDLHLVTLAEPIGILTITSNCNSIFFSGNNTVTWYRNDEIYSENKNIIKPVTNGEYYVASENACGGIESNRIEFSRLDKNSLFIPNIITPNDDDANQYFEVDKQLESPSMQIFNRWGKEVYHSASYQDTWDGSNLADGVYFYTIQSQCLDETLKGTLTIKR